MAEFLTDKANFKCSGSPAVKFQIIEPTNHKVKYDGAPVLTDAAQIIGTGNCPLLAAKLGVPSAPCSCSLSGWIQFDVNKKINSKFLLTKNSKNFCITGGGNISVNSGGTGGKFSQGLKPVSVAVSSANKNFESTQNNFDAQKEISVKKNFDAQNKTSSAVKENFTDKKGNSALPVEIVENIKFRCGTEKCPNKNCPHFKPNDFRDSALIEKDAVKLRKNYYKYIGEKINFDSKEIERQFQLENETRTLDFCLKLCEKIYNSPCTDADKFWIKSVVRLQEIFEETNQLAWWYAAHHIIPGNEVFKKFPKSYCIGNLVSDKNEPVFDINCAENCIMLLMNNPSAKYDTFFDKLKKYLRKKDLPSFMKNLLDVNMFELMEAVEKEHKFKIQWHVGQHIYTFKKDELKQTSELFKKKFPGKNIISYENAVISRMNAVESSIDLKSVCPMKVRTDILNLIKNIRLRLEKFAVNPCDSFPYFVTKDNYFYALFH